MPAARHIITAAVTAAVLVVAPAAAHGKTTPHHKKGPKATIALGDKRPSQMASFGFSTKTDWNITRQGIYVLRGLADLGASSGSTSVT